MPVVLGLLPLFGCAIGLYRALLSTSTEVLRQTVETIAAFKTPDKVAEAYRKLESTLGGRADFDAGMLPKLDQVLSALVPQAILDLPLRSAELSVAIYAGMAICAVLAALLVLSMMLAGRPLQGNLASRGLSSGYNLLRPGDLHRHLGAVRSSIFQRRSGHWVRFHERARAHSARWRWST
jgi:hypothetical protein